jgi:hypothetical protein
MCYVACTGEGLEAIHALLLHVCHMPMAESLDTTVLLH